MTRFEIDAEMATRYPVRTAGGRTHEELWVPGQELAEFNAHIVGIIFVVEAFTGPDFAGTLDPASHLPADL